LKERTPEELNAEINKKKAMLKENEKKDWSLEYAIINKLK